MPNIFGEMKRKSKREFDKLPKEKKLEVFQTAITQKVSGVMSKEIAKSMIRGMELERENIYKKYVANIDSCEDNYEKSNIINSLLSYLRLEHLKFLQNENEPEKAKDENGG